MKDNNLGDTGSYGVTEDCCDILPWQLLAHSTKRGHPDREGMTHKIEEMELTV